MYPKKTARDLLRTGLGAGLALGAGLLLSSCGAKPASVRITPPKLVFYGFEKTQILKAEVLDKKGRVLEGLPVAWESSRPDVVSVQSTGVVKSVGAGSSMITAKVEGASAQVKVDVHDVGSITLAPARATIAGAKGATAALAAQVLDRLGQPSELKPVFTSSDPKVATVDDSGKVTGVSEGRVAVTAALGDIGASAEVRILFREIASFEVSPATVPLKAGDAAHLTVVARDPAGTLIEDVAVVWSSSDPKTAVCANGTVRGISPGAATIRGTCGPKSAEISVLVF